MKDVLAICTRNRAGDLEKCLASLTKLEVLPAFVFVVDSSTDDASRALTERYRNSLPGVDVRYLRSDSKGLVVARNVALNNLPSDCQVVHFVDDDTELQQGYIAEINKVLAEQGTDVVGAGGMIVGHPKGKTSALLKSVKLDSDKLGAVLASGVNIGSYECASPIEMDWLPGCSMSFRAPAISGLEFDPRRDIWPLGEDVDFGLKARTRGRLVHVPQARILHNLSPTNRDDIKTINFQDVVHRWTLASDGLGAVKKGWVLISTLARIYIFISSAFKSANKFALELAFATARGLWVAIAMKGLAASRTSGTTRV
jgi:GT2 family glycosyltransferase